MKHALAILLLSASVVFGQTLTNTNLDGVTNATLNGKLDDDTAASRTALGLGTAATADKSTTGGANKVPQFDIAGRLVTDNLTPSGFGSATKGIYVGDLQFFGMLKTNGQKMGGLYGWEAHSGGGEVILDSASRIAIAPGAHSAIQLGLSIAGGTGYVYVQSQGNATSENPGKSKPLYFVRQYWTGSGSAFAKSVGIEAGGDGIDSELVFFANGTEPDGAGLDGSRPEIVAVTVDGLRDPGNYPTFTTLDGGSNLTVTCSKTKSSQNAKTTLTGNRTVTVSGAVAGMRGVILVTQDSGGSRTLTPTEGTALDLSNTAGYVDRVSWEFDGLFYHWSTVKNVSLSLPALDADATAFISAASITDTAKKAAVDALVTDLKAANLWTRFYAIYPFIGDSGDGVANSYNLRDTGAYRITWTGSPTHDANGVTGVVSTAYGNTGINLNTLGATNSAFGYVYCRTQTPTDAKYFFGANATNRFNLSRSGGSLAVGGPNNTNILMNIGASSDFRRHVAINRASSVVAQIYMDSTVSTVDATVSTAAPNANIHILGRSDAASTGTNANLAFAAFGPSVNPSEWATFVAIIDTFQTALGRANP